MTILLGLLIGTLAGLLWIALFGLRVRKWEVPPQCHTMKGWRRLAWLTVFFWPVVMLGQLFLPDAEAMIRTTASVNPWSVAFGSVALLTGWIWGRSMVLAISTAAGTQVDAILKFR